MDIDALLKELKNNIFTLLGNKYKEFKPELQQDLNNYLNSSKAKLERWSLLLADNSIDKEEFLWLLKSQQDLIELKALQTAGLSKIKLNNLKNNIISIIFDTVVKVVLVSL
jgi:hypothetical protein